MACFADADHRCTAGTRIVDSIMEEDASSREDYPRIAVELVNPDVARLYSVSSRAKEDLAEMPVCAYFSSVCAYWRDRYGYNVISPVLYRPFLKMFFSVCYLRRRVCGWLCRLRGGYRIPWLRSVVWPTRTTRCLLFMWYAGIAGGLSGCRFFLLFTLFHKRRYSLCMGIELFVGHLLNRKSR